MRTALLALALLATGTAKFYQSESPAKRHFALKPSYDSIKLHVAQLRSRLKNTVNLNDTATLQKNFVAAVTDSIVPYWYGTPRDFNGTTQVPGKGTIACGYFVSTVLRDAGLTINRVLMGQGSSENLTYALAEKKDIRIFCDKPLPTVLQYIKTKGTGLYIIGLDCHVGFILNDEKGIWFIHSKWFGEKVVVKEDAATSNILYYSKYRMIGKISSSRKLLSMWLSNNPVGQN